MSAPLVNDPGTAWAYGVNTDWLGLVVESVLGQRLGQVVQEQIYGRLGMADSTFSPDADQRTRLLRLMQRQADGGLAPSVYELPSNPEWDSGGHGSYGTVQDYGRFLQAWLNEGGSILRPETADMALCNHLGAIKLPTASISTKPDLTNVVPSRPWPQGWGLGFHLTLTDLPGMRSHGTADWAGLFNSYYWLDRKKGIGCVLMTQLLPFFDMSVIQTLIGFEMAVYQQVGAVVQASLPSSSTKN